MYDLLYNVCSWVGNPRVHLLQKHIEQLKTIKHSLKKDLKILCIFSLMIDNFNQFNKDEYLKLADQNNENITILVKFYPNWNGSWGSLWLNWKYLVKPLNINIKYFSSFEDDYLINKDGWFDLALDIVNKKDLSYLGMVSINKTNTKSMNIESYNYGGKKYTLGTKYINNIEERRKWIKQKRCCRPKDTYFDFKDMEWTDGGGYLLIPKESIESWENKFRKFIDQSYNKSFEYNDYIDIGEVGFPTKLKINGYKFIGIKYDEVMIMLDPDDSLSKVNKSIT